MSYLNIDQDYFKHEKVLRLEFALGPGSSVLPIRLWAVAAVSCPLDGIFKNIRPEELENFIGWWGERGKCCAEMVRLEFLEKNEEDLCVHNWKNHQGHIIAYKKRSKIANRKRWNNQSKSKDSLTDKQGVHNRQLRNPPNYTILDYTNNKKELLDFETFWTAYPNKQAKKVALKSWLKIKPDLAICLKALESQRHSDQWINNNGRYIPMASTWLNGERWNDSLTNSPDRKDQIDLDQQILNGLKS